MQVLSPNNIKIYNLSAGKSLPEWLSGEKKSKLEKKEAAENSKNRIQLIQDFEMPTVSNCVAISPDRQYIFAAGIYKPRVCCYETSNLSIKFERCIDYEVLQMKVLSEDFSKFVLLQIERHVEFHVASGLHFRTRIPKPGRDMAFENSSCDLYIVGASNEIYRLNLNQGRFMTPIETNATEITCCQFNPEHNLFMCGTSDGTVECWDPRSRERAGLLDCCLSQHAIEKQDSAPGVSALKCANALTFAVGSTAGQVLLYDLRSNHPVVVKDHGFGYPVKAIEFHRSADDDYVLSADSRLLKIWRQSDGKSLTSLEPGTTLNGICIWPDSGLIFMPNEAPKILAYYIPTLGHAPKWCSFLDNLVEELEEDNETGVVYDDYKFVTRRELDDLGLTHLIGSQLLRAYMHGFFMDVRLYHKARAAADPFAYDRYRKSKIRAQIEAERGPRVPAPAGPESLPKVNRSLAERFLKLQVEDEALKQTQGKSAKNNKEKETKEKEYQKPKLSSCLVDERFKDLFANPDFEINPESDEFKLINPLIRRLDKIREKKSQDIEKKLNEKRRKKANTGESDEDDEEDRDSDKSSSTMDSDSATSTEDEDEKDSDEDAGWKEDLRQSRRDVLFRQQRFDPVDKTTAGDNKRARVFELKAGLSADALTQSNGSISEAVRQVKRPLGERLESTADQQTSSVNGSARQMSMTFTPGENKRKRGDMSKRGGKAADSATQHRSERRAVRRSAAPISQSFAGRLSRGGGSARRGRRF